MSTALPPTLDPRAAARWARLQASASPWLHEEVARRMQERLQWIAQAPTSWLHWEPLRGGLQAHAQLRRHYAQARCYVLQEEASAQLRQALAPAPAPAPWSLAYWRGGTQTLGAPEQPVQMVWANMALHQTADPLALIERWHGLLQTGGFVMFSCLGPDTLRELRPLYAAHGWPEPAQHFTDMHDWGDMLLRAQFAEPVMDMERITLTFATPERLLQELRELGRNLHPQRFAALRGRAWQAALRAALQNELPRSADGRLQLSFEIVYGHAFKAAPRVRVAAQTHVSLDAMREQLRQIKKFDHDH